MILLGKKMDPLHYGLFIMLVVTIGTAVSFHEWDNNTNQTSRLSQYLVAKITADSILLSGNFDQAEKAYIKIKEQYPHRVNLPEQLKAMNHKRNQYETYLELQDELNTHIETIEQLESYMTIIERRYHNLSQEQGRINQVNVYSEETRFKVDSVVDNSIVNDLASNVKGILEIINFDGVEIKYIGEVKNNEANGYGYAVFAKKGFYEGFWANNMRNGNGIYYWQNGDTYAGSYVDGKREGMGTYTFASGEIYTGDWQDNFRNGNGKLINKKGKLVFEGIWEGGEPVLKSKK